MNTGLKPVWAGCNMRLDPFRLPQATSYATRDDFGDVHFTIDQRGVVVRRVLEKSGLPVTVVLPARVFRGVALLPARARVRAQFGVVDDLTDPTDPVDVERDHVRGPLDAPVTLVEYGDLECPYCGQAEPAVRELLVGCTDVRYVWRHLPLRDVHPQAFLAALAAEAAARQDRFWDMHDLLLRHQDALQLRDLVGYAGELGLDVDRFTHELKAHKGAARIEQDVEGAAASGVRGTPTFFVNGRRHQGAYDLPALLAAVDEARRLLALADPPAVADG